MDRYCAPVIAMNQWRKTTSLAGQSRPKIIEHRHIE
jgi:hypothetical protein